MNNWLKKLKKKAILPAAAFLVAAAAIGTTFAWQQWDLSITNNLVSHTVVVEENEKFEPDKGTKEVIFKNTGDASVFLRVSYSEYWIKGEKELPDNKNEGPHWIDGENTTNILSNIVNGSEVAVKTWGDKWPQASSPSSTDIWFKAPDGWYYYKKVLLPDETTKEEEILKRVGFISPRPQGYDVANYRLFFKAEVVQCSDGVNTLNSEAVNAKATKELFGLSAKVDQNGVVVWEGEADGTNK